MNTNVILRNVKIKFIVMGTIAVMLAVIAFNLNASFSDRFLHNIDRTIELLKISSSNDFEYSDLEKLKSEPEFSNITGYSEVISGVSNKFGVYKGGIKAVLTDADYVSVYNSKMIAGSFFDEEADKKGEAYAVISDRLAVKLFKSIDVIGSEINVFGKKYIVTGIYESVNTILWELFGDGYDRIFIPRSSVDNYMEKSVDVLAFYKKDGHDITDVSRILKDEFGSMISAYKILEYEEAGALLIQFYNIVIFIIGILSIVLTMTFLIKYSVNKIRYFRKKMQSHYILEIFKTETFEIARSLSVFAICVSCIIVLVKAIQFKFHIADKYIPNDNIFDLHFYLKAVISDIMTSNSHSSNVYSILEYNYKNVLQAELFITFMSMFLFIVALMFFKLLLMLDNKFLNILKLVITVIFTGGATGICVSIFLGLGALLPIKTLMVGACFLILLLLIHPLRDK